MQSVPHWYAHLTWQATPDARPLKDVLTRLTGSVGDLERVPGTEAYVRAPDGYVWRAGFAVTADTIEDAAAAAAATIRAALLDAGQLDAEVTGLEVLGETHRDRWALHLPPAAHPAA